MQYLLSELPRKGIIRDFSNIEKGDVIETSNFEIMSDCQMSTDIASQLFDAMKKRATQIDAKLTKFTFPKEIRYHLAFI